MNEDGVLKLREWIFLGVFAVLLFAVPITVVWASYSQRFRLDVRSLWTHHERIDKLGVILMGTWWVHTCSMILWTLMLKVQTTDYLTYTLWATPIIVKMLTPGGGEPLRNGEGAGAAPNPELKGKP